MAKGKAGFPKAFPKGDYDVEYVVRESGSDAIVALHWMKAGMTRLSKDEPKGVEIALPEPQEHPRLTRGLAPTVEGTFVFHPNDRSIRLCDRSGAVRATCQTPFLDKVVTFLGHPTRPEVVFVWDERDAGVATTARIYRLSAGDMLEGKAPTLLAERPYRPTIAFDDAGALVAVDSGTIFTFEPGSTTPQATSIQLPNGAPVVAAKLSASGDRLVLQESPMGGELVILDRNGALIRRLPGLIAERTALIEAGRTLALTAQLAKSRTGSASYVQWPDPRMLESYVALLDVDSGQVRGLAPRSAGRTTSFVIIENELLVVASYGRSRKIELLPWSALTP
ncbi:Hypothetical protein A7982_08339 [Minicystis rosea]|nr:Hypothetical protein A7982_08339 [Minicystis rosea]